MLVAFLPFPTAVLAQAFLHGTDEPIAAAFYGGTLAVLGILVDAMWFYAARGNRLLDPHVPSSEVRQVGRRYLVGPLVYAVAAVVALALPWAALLAYLFVNVFYLWPGRVPENALARADNAAASRDRRVGGG
jgi:uncharacterized membrane protein